MKTLELKQMESLQGGWSWFGCVNSAGTLVFAYGSNLAAVAIGGLWGAVAAGVVGCVAGGLAMSN